MQAMRIAWGPVFVALSVLAGCDSTVIRESDDAGSSSEQGGGHHDGSVSSVDPEAQCRLLELIMSYAEECSKVWDDVPCERSLRFANEHGCLEETLENLRCLAETCEDAAACEAVGDAYVECNDRRRKD